MDDFKIELNDGKYTILWDFEKRQFECLRYGEPWRDFIGDQMMMSLCLELIEKSASNTMDNNIKEIWEQHFTEAQEENADDPIDHSFLCKIASDRTIDDLVGIIHGHGDNRHWAHIEAVNEGFFGG